MSARLQFNPEPLKVVPDAQREVWTRNTYNWRCEHEDGRGQCASRETRTFWNKDARRAEALCEKHSLASRPQAERATGDTEEPT